MIACGPPAPPRHRKYHPPHWRYFLVRFHAWNGEAMSVGGGGGSGDYLRTTLRFRSSDRTADFPQGRLGTRLATRRFHLCSQPLVADPIEHRMNSSPAQASTSADQPPHEGLEGQFWWDRAGPWWYRHRASIPAYEPPSLTSCRIDPEVEHHRWGRQARTVVASGFCGNHGVRGVIDWPCCKRPVLLVLGDTHLAVFWTEILWEMIHDSSQARRLTTQLLRLPLSASVTPRKFTAQASLLNLLEYRSGIRAVVTVPGRVPLIV